MYSCIPAAETRLVVTARCWCWVVVTLALALCHLSHLLPSCDALPVIQVERAAFADNLDLEHDASHSLVADAPLGLDDNFIVIKPHAVFKVEFEAKLRSARSYHDVIRIFYNYSLTDDLIEQMVTSPNGSIVIKRQVAPASGYLTRLGGVKDYDWETGHADAADEAFWAGQASPAAEARRLDSGTGNGRDASDEDESKAPPCDNCEIIPADSSINGASAGISASLMSQLPVTRVSGDQLPSNRHRHGHHSDKTHTAERRGKSNKRANGKTHKSTAKDLPQPQAIDNPVAAMEMATEHVKEMLEEGSCKPQQRIIHLRDLQLAANKAYYPDCTTVYRCPRDACCQQAGHQCVPSHKVTITRHFMMLHQSASGDEPVVGLSPGGLDILALNFVNHTSCHCSPVKPLPPCLPCPHPFEQTRSSETLRCRCVCASDHTNCHKMRQGRVPLPSDKLRCVKEKKCAKPACRYGQFNEITSYCPPSHASHSDIQADSWSRDLDDIDINDPSSVYRYE